MIFLFRNFHTFGELRAYVVPNVTNTFRQVNKWNMNETLNHYLVMPETREIDFHQQLCVAHHQWSEFDSQIIFVYTYSVYPRQTARLLYSTLVVS